MRYVILAVLLMSVVGCSGGGAVPLSALDPTPYTLRNARGSAFRLKQDVTINGQLVPAGSYVSGLRAVDTGDATPLDKVEWIIKPEFEHLRGRGDIVFAKRFGERHWVRLEMDGRNKPREVQTPYVDIACVEYNLKGGGGHHQFDRWAGLTDDGTVVLFDARGRVAVIFKDVEGFKSIDLLRAEGAMVVRHRDYDRVYASSGRPISPELPRMWSAYVMVSPHGQSPEAEAKAFGVATDAAKQRYWLLQDDGHVLPKPDDLIGVQPRIGTNQFGTEFWDGWLVWWKTPQGDRCAPIGLKEATTDLAAVLATRERAEYEEFVTNYYSRFNYFVYIVRRAGESEYEIIDRGDVLPKRFESVAAAEKYLDGTRKAEAEAFARAVKENDRQKAAREAAERREREAEARRKREAAEAAKAKAIAAARSAFDAEMSRNNQRGAREQLLKLAVDADRWTKYVRKYGLDPADNQSSTAVSYTRARAGGTEDAVLQAALKKSQPQAAAAYSGPQSDWDYFWNGPRPGQQPHATRERWGNNPVGSLQQMGNQIESTRQQNLNAWLRGAQNWGGPR